MAFYNSDLQLLRDVSCRDFSIIRCNSKFVFGLWDADYKNEILDDDYYDDDDDSDDDDDDSDDDDDDSDVQDAKYSSRSIQVYHLDTLNQAFSLCVPKKYTMHRIMVDEHHMVAMSHLKYSELDSRQWFMSIFDLATCNESGGGYGQNRDVRFFPTERHIELTIEPLLLSSVFLLNDWLVVPLKNANELVWFDERGKRSETSTKLNNINSNVRAIYLSGLSLLFAVEKDKLLLKQL